MMEVYIQEVMALQYMSIISEESKYVILQVAQVFPQVFSRVVQLHDAGVPEHVWHIILSR